MKPGPPGGKPGAGPPVKSDVAQSGPPKAKLPPTQ